MHYYKKNIGDYSKKAARLSILQHGIYNLLIDACYDREKFPTRDEAIDWIWASSKEEIEGVDFVLRKFFEEQEDGTFVQNRIAEELGKYKKRCQTNRENRNSDGDESKTKDDESSTTGQRNEQNQNATINHKPLTTNHKIYIPENFAVSEQVEAWAKKKGYTRLDERLDHFVDWAKASRKRYSDWDAVFRNAIRGDWAKLGDQPSNVDPMKALGIKEI